MKSLYLKSGKTQDVFSELSNALEGTLLSDNGEHNLALETRLVKGNINGISFPEGVSYMQFDLVFRDDVMLSIESLSNSALFFAYCFEGGLTHSIGTMGDKKSLNKSQTAILKTKSSINTILYFEKNVPIKFSIIGIGTNRIGEGVNDILTKKLRDTFFSNEDLMHLRLQNFKIAEKIDELNAIKQKGIVRKLLKKEIIKNILAIEIEQHNDSFAKMSEAISDMALRQIDEIRRVSDFIINLSAEVLSLKYFKKNAVAVSNNINI